VLCRVFGSECDSHEELWEQFKKSAERADFELQVDLFNRGDEHKKEKRVDVNLATFLALDVGLRHALNQRREYVLVSGDGDFVNAIMQPLWAGFPITMWTWRNSCNKEFFDLAEKAAKREHPYTNFRLRFLDEIERLSFTQVRYRIKEWKKPHVRFSWPSSRDLEAIEELCKKSKFALFFDEYFDKHGNRFVRIAGDFPSHATQEEQEAYFTRLTNHLIEQLGVQAAIVEHVVPPPPSFEKWCHQRQFCTKDRTCADYHPMEEVQLQAFKVLACDHQPCMNFSCTFWHAEKDQFCTWCYGLGHLASSCKSVEPAASMTIDEWEKRKQLMIRARPEPAHEHWCRHREFCVNGNRCKRFHPATDQKLFESHAKGLQRFKTDACSYGSNCRKKSKCTFWHSEKDKFCSWCGHFGHVQEECHKPARTKAIDEKEAEKLLQQGLRLMYCQSLENFQCLKQ